MTATLNNRQENAITTGVRDPRLFVSAEVWDREVQLMMRDHPFDKIMAERVFGQAIAYLITSIEKKGQELELGPGPIVDIGVHTFMLDTPNYFEFCEEHNGGRYLHHFPAVEFKLDGTVNKTAKVIEDNGFVVDWSLWEADFAKCSPCHAGSDSH